MQSIEKEQYIFRGGQKDNVLQSIPFDDANRDDDAHSGPDTAVHAPGFHLKRFHRFSYLLRKIADMEENTTREKQANTKKRANSIRDKIFLPTEK